MVRLNHASQLFCAAVSNPTFPAEAQKQGYRLPAERAKVQGQADDYQPALIFNTNPGAIDGVPVANQHCNVLGGNGRTMATALVYAGLGSVPAVTHAAGETLRTT